MISRRVQFELARHAVGPTLLAIQDWQRRLRRRRPGRAPTDRRLFGPPIEATRKLKDLMTLHYLEGRYADGAVPVAWATSGFPVEVLRPLGFHVVYPENHGALCAVQRASAELAGVAEKEGFSPDLCGYARADIGSVLSGTTPVGRVPRPDLLACCTNICKTVLYWYRVLAERLNVPLVMVDTPFLYGAAKPHQIEYVRDQLVELTAIAEQISRKRVDFAELMDVMRLSREGCSLWADCLAAGKARPAPWTGFDQFIHMAPIVALRGTEECNAYYRVLRDELRDRAARGVGGIAEERYRLLWDNLPIWYKMRDLAMLFAEHGFNFVCSTYVNAWAEPANLIDEEHPVTSAALAYSSVLLNRDLGTRLSEFERLAREYGAAGAVLHSNRSCKPYSVGQMDIRERLARDLGIKALVLEADHADPRAYSDEQSETRLRAFMESFS